MAKKPWEEHLYSQEQQAAQPENQGNETSWLDQMKGYLNQINNRPAFQFDLDKDQLYKQYKNQYTRLGNQAMRDTIGQAAALTGGYANSYAQTAGQQQYNAWLEKLNAMVPELYAQARSSYDKEGQDLYNRFGLAQTMYWQEQDDAYRAWQQKMQEQDAANDLQNQNRSYAMQLLAMGIMPSAADLQAAGMDANYAQQIINYYKAQQTGSGGGGYGGNGNGNGSTIFANTRSAIIEAARNQDMQAAKAAIDNAERWASDEELQELIDMFDRLFPQVTPHNNSGTVGSGGGGAGTRPGDRQSHSLN